MSAGRHRSDTNGNRQPDRSEGDGGGRRVVGVSDQTHTSEQQELHWWRGGERETHFSPTRRQDITEAQTTDGREKSSAGKLKRLRSSSSSNTG